MSKETFPLLKNSVRIKRYESLCFVIDAVADNGTPATPLQAFLLSLCNGAYDVLTLKYIFAGTLRQKQEDVAAQVDEVFDKFGKYLVWQPESRRHDSRYAPASFLYDCQPSSLVSRGRLESPAQATLVLTHACNFRCPYCFNSSARAGAGELDAVEWLAVVDHLRELDVVKCTLSGGEPLLHPGFLEILRKVIGYGMTPYVCTNGSLLDGPGIARLVDGGLSAIQISLDAASPEVHDRMSATRGTFPQVVAAIRDLVAADFDVYVKAVVTPMNRQDAEPLIDLCHSLGVKRLLLDRFDVSNAGRGNSQLFLSPQQEGEIAAMVARKQEEIGRRLELQVVNGPRIWVGKENIISCGALRTSVNILPNGDVSACEKLIDFPEMTAGNVRREHLAEIWRSDRADRICNPPPELVNEPCRSCEHFKECRTGCYAAALLVSDNPFAADPRCWKAHYQANPYLSAHSDEET